MSDHTPGPWKCDGRGDGSQQLPIRGAHRKIIAAVRDEGSLADGHLIAAAPELLEACRAAETALDTINTDNLYYKGDLVPRTLRIVQAAIAKYEGKE